MHSMPSVIMKNVSLFAIAILLLSISASLYVKAIQTSNETDEQILIVNNQAYAIDKLFSTFEHITITTDDGQKTGIPLDSLILDTGLEEPATYEYTMKATDYQQTVKWEHIQTGILSQEQMKVYFPTLAHAFWVHDIIEIEVNKI